MQKSLFLILTIGFVGFGCSSSEESEISGKDKSDIRTLNRDVAQISYDIDITTLVEPIGTPTDLDKSMMTPFTEKERVTMKIKENGDIRLVTEKLNPRSSIVINHRTLPNSRPEITKTILDNNAMELYDIQGTLIRSVAGQSIKMPYLADKIIEALKTRTSANINQILACIRSNVNLDSLNKIISNPPAGVTVTALTSNLTSIRMPAPPELKSSEAKEVVLIVDVTNKLLAGTRLYGANNKTLQCMIYRYNDCIFKGFKQEVQETLPSGILATIKTYADIENINLTSLL